MKNKQQTWEKKKPSSHLTKILRDTLIIYRNSREIAQLIFDEENPD